MYGGISAGAQPLPAERIDPHAVYGGDDDTILKHFGGRIFHASSLHAISTYWGIVLVSVAFGLPMPIFLYTNFIVSIPQSLDDAGAIDGCNSVQTFFYIILPQLKPITASIVILNGVGMWNEYGYSLYILQKPKMYTLTLMISQYFSASAVSDLNGAAAAACVAIAPVVILYLFLQKYFVQGQLDSAVKG